MDSSVDDIAPKPSMRRGASFDNALVDGSPTSGFARTELEGHHIQQAAQGSWQATPAIQMDAQFGFMEEPEDTRPLLPALFPGSDCYGNAQFSSLVMGSSTWDSKLSYPPGASDGIAGIPIAITGNASGLSGHGQVVVQGNSANSLAIPGPGHMPGGFVHASPGLRYPKARLDFAHPALEHMHLGQAHNNGDVSVGKTMMIPQPWVLPSGSCPMDPSSEGLPAHVMSFTSPNGLSSLPADPGFAERAAKFSAFGNVGISECSFSGDGSKDRNKVKLNLMKPVRQFGCTAKRSGPSSPSGNTRFSTKEAGSAVPMEDSCKGVDTLSSFLPAANVGREGDEAGQKQVCASVNESDESLGQEVSSSCGPASMQGLPESNGRKRKAGLQKLKDGGCFATNNPKDMDPDDGGPKCLGGSENTFDKSVKQPQEQSNSGNSEESTPKSAKEASKPPEAPRSDFIHVRARRGQATDSHSLAERVRREKISERMKFLQDLVPGCSKVTGKAVMLDEIINYVQSLQRQVEFLSMKLAAVNPRVEFSIDNLFARERPVQPRAAAPVSGFVIQNPNLFPPSHLHQQPHVQIQSLDQCPVREVQAFGSDPVLRRTLSTPPVMETYGDPASQAAQAWEDELQSVVQMNFAQRQPALDLQGPFFQGQMKVEQ